MSDVSNVKILPVGSRRHPDGILEDARNAKLDKVIVIGWDEAGYFFCSGSESLEYTIYMLRNAEHELFAYMGRAEAAG